MGGGVILFLTLFSIECIGQPFCREVTPQEITSLNQWLSSAPPVVAGAIPFPRQVPLRFIYVTYTNGSGQTTLPNDWTESIPQKVAYANTVFSGLFEFYVCGYKVVNVNKKSIFLGALQQQIDIYNLYNDPNAVNIYIIQSIFGATAFAYLPTYQLPNNCIRSKF